MQWPYTFGILTAVITFLGMLHCLNWQSGTQALILRPETPETSQRRDHAPRYESSLPSRILKFSHITKTGGTSVENVAWAKGVSWGRYDYDFHRLFQYDSESWHRPIGDLPASEQTKYDWFVIVRDPIDRIVSEFHCRWGGVGDSESGYDVASFNRYIRRRIDELEMFRTTNHYRPQHHYLPSRSDVSMTTLKFENLTRDFDALMRLYGMDRLRLTTHANARIKSRFTREDFDEATRNLIAKVYRDDFELWWNLDSRSDYVQNRAKSLGSG